MQYNNVIFDDWQMRMATPENPAVSLNDPETWKQLFGGIESEAGIAVTPETVLGLAPFWQGVSLLSGDVAKLPLVVYQRTDDDGRERNRKHPADRLIHRRPNDEQTAFKFWRCMMTFAVLWNNGYARIVRRGDGAPLSLIPLHPDRVTTERHAGRLRYLYDAGGGRDQAIDAFDMLHIHGLSIDCMGGADMVYLARTTLGLGLATQRFGAKFFKSGAKAGGILQIPDGMSKPAGDNLEKTFDKAHSSAENWFKTVVLRDGAKYLRTQLNNDEAQYLETRREQVREAARLLNLPPHKLGDDSKSSFASLEQENRSYLESSLAPWLESIAQECSGKLLTADEQDSHYCEHNTAALLKTDIQSRYETYAIGITNGILSRNEARRKENLPPVPGGDVFLVPLNMAPATASERQSLTDLLAEAIGRCQTRLRTHAEKAARRDLSFDTFEHMGKCQEILQSSIRVAASVLQTDAVYLMARVLDELQANYQTTDAAEFAAQLINT